MKTVALLLLLLTALLGQQNGVTAQLPADVGPTVSVDFAMADLGAKSQVGILHGLDATQPPDSAINPLNPKQSLLVRFARVV